MTYMEHRLNELQSPPISPQAQMPPERSMLAAIISRPAAAPWVLLFLWLAVQLNAVIYWSNHEWGFLGDLWLLFLYAGSAAAFCTWMCAWAILSDAHWKMRAAYLLVGLILLGLITAPIIPWWQDADLAVALAAILVGNSVALALVRLRGRQLRLINQDTPAVKPGEPDQPQLTAATARAFQFSLLDMLVLMTGIAAVLALMLLVGGPPDTGEVAILCDHILCGPVILVTTLAWRRYFLALLVSFVFTLSLTTAAIALVEPHLILQPTNWLIILMYAGPALMGLWVAALVVRGRGYRLTAAQSKS
jgi:hypothetical protein